MKNLYRIQFIKRNGTLWSEMIRSNSVAEAASFAFSNPKFKKLTSIQLIQKGF